MVNIANKGSKMNKIAIPLLLLIIFTSINIVNTYEDQEGRVKRFKFYQDIRKFSNYTMTVGVDPFNGLYCQADSFIPAGGKTLRVPKDHAMCPYYIFPFKFEIVEFLHAVKGLDNSIGKEQKFSVFVLVYNILYQLYANKVFLKEYIDKNNLTMYQNLEFDVIDNIENSFPKIILGKSTLEHEHFKLMAEKKISGDPSDELAYVYKSVLYQISKSPHMEAMFHWTSNFERFRHAYGVVMSRGMTLRLNEYYTLVNHRKRQSSYSQWDKKNLDINQNICKTTGCPCIVLYIDLCNHFHPKFRDFRDKRPIILDTEIDYFINAATREYDIGDEINYTYSNDPNNVVMFLHYGFVIPDNIFNVYKLRIFDEVKLTPEQTSLCNELTCFEKTYNNDPYSKGIYTIQYGTFSVPLLNLARIGNLKKNEFTVVDVLKKIKSSKPISLENEMLAWAFYVKQVRREWVANAKKNMEDSIKNGQMYRKKRRVIEQEWKDEETQRTQWRDLRHFDLIYDMDISFKRIVLDHLVRGEKNLISTLHDSITNNLKAKILSQFKN